MALVTDLMGLGDSAAHAGRLGHQITTGLVGSGTTQTGGATVITTSVTVGVPAASFTAYLLPTAPSMAKEYYFFNNAATAITALIYPVAGGMTLNGSTSSSVSIAQNKGCMFMCVAGSGGTAPQWVAINSA